MGGVEGAALHKKTQPSPETANLSSWRSRNGTMPTGNEHIHTKDWAAMRLHATQVQLTKQIVDRLLGVPNRIWLFGSRARDDLRGGDIDLLVETDTVVPNRAEMICRIYGALIMALGDQKIDILLKDARTSEVPIFDIARRTGVLL